MITGRAKGSQGGLKGTSSSPQSSGPQRGLKGRAQVHRVQVREKASMAELKSTEFNLLAVSRFLVFLPEVNFTQRGWLKSKGHQPAKGVSRADRTYSRDLVINVAQLKIPLSKGMSLFAADRTCKLCFAYFVSKGIVHTRASNSISWLLQRQNRQALQ